MPAKRSNPKTMHRAGELRKELTPAEKKLWAYSGGDKLNGVSFRRQHAIGNFIGGFPLKGTMCLSQEEIILELDGSQHPEQADYDLERTSYLEAQGYKVIRFWNNQVENDTPALACDLVGKSGKC